MVGKKCYKVKTGEVRALSRSSVVDKLSGSENGVRVWKACLSMALTVQCGYKYGY